MHSELIPQINNGILKNKKVVITASELEPVKRRENGKGKRKTERVKG